MIILITLAALLIISLLLYAFTDFEAAGFAFSVTFGVILFAALISIPVSRAEDGATIASHYALEETLSTSRMENLSEIERAAILTKIAEHNQLLASARYFNDTILDIWIADELAELPFLK